MKTLSFENYKPRKALQYGQVFGNLTVICPSLSVDSNDNRYYWFKCSCGAEVDIVGQSVLSGNSSSCGCRKFTHAMSKSVEYKTWQAMKARCTNSKNKSYIDYGARGIKVCDRWLESFENFYSDMGDKPAGDYSLDRVDNDLDYSPDNCRWATRDEQNRNKRCNKQVTVNDVVMLVSEYADQINTPRTTVYRWYTNNTLPDGVEVYHG